MWSVEIKVVFPVTKQGYYTYVYRSEFAYNKIANLIPSNNQVKKKTTIDSISQSIAKTSEILIAICIIEWNVMSFFYKIVKSVINSLLSLNISSC